MKSLAPTSRVVRATASGSWTTSLRVSRSRANRGSRRSGSGGAAGRCGHSVRRRDGCRGPAERAGRLARRPGGPRCGPARRRPRPCRRARGRRPRPSTCRGCEETSRAASRTASTRPSARSRSYLHDDVGRARSGRAAPDGRPARAPRRRPAGCRRSHGSRPVGLDRDVGLGDEVLVAAEGPQRGLLPGRVAVEGEDHLAAELLVVVEEPAQHPRVVVAERRAAGGDGGRDAGQVAGHHVGVALDDDGLRSCGRSRGGPGRGRRAPGSSCRSAVSGVLRYFASMRSSSKIRRAPKPMVSPLDSRIGQSSRPRNRSYADRGRPRPARPATISSSVKPFCAQVAQQCVAVARCEADAELLGRGLVEAALGEELAGRHGVGRRERSA